MKEEVRKSKINIAPKKLLNTEIVYLVLQSKVADQFSPSLTISKKVAGKNVHATIPKSNMGFDQYAVADTVAVSNPLLLLSFSIRKHSSMAFRAILSNFFNEYWNQYHPQYLSELSRTPFLRTFLEIAVYVFIDITFTKCRINYYFSDAACETTLNNQSNVLECNGFN